MFTSALRNPWQGSKMTDAMKDVHVWQTPVRNCPTCTTPARYMTSILDVKRDRLVRLFRCDPCKKEIWDD